MTCSYLQVFKHVWVFDTIQERNDFLIYVGDSDYSERLIDDI